MKFNEMWLQEWIKPKVNSQILIEQLTMIGFKTNKVQSISNYFHGVIIGEIIECYSHQDFQNIWIAKVFIGNKKILNIFCKAINCRKNIRVVVAHKYSILPENKKIKPIKIYKRLSEGILCSFKTLGISSHEEKIIELPKDAPIGKNFHDYFNLNDNVIDISVTQNRGDCLSILGISREIATVNRITLKKLKIPPIIPTIPDIIKIKIQNFSLCPKFSGRIIKNIDTNIPTPLWIKEKLKRCDICLVNIIIDISNYVLLELGQPIYIYDFEKITGKTLYVGLSHLKKNSSLINENKKLKLHENTLIIFDKKNLLSIAGIKEEEKFIVNSSTRNIFLQSAFFDPKIIAKQSKLYNINTLSSYRYIRGVDPKISKLALEYITSLLLKVCGGSPGPIISTVNEKFFPKLTIIKLYRSKLDRIIGFHIPNNEITDILTRLGFQICLLNNYWKILKPSWRFDISCEEDIIEEIIRIHGYNNIPKHHIHTNLKLVCHTNKPDTYTSLLKTKFLLTNLGYQEIITYSFVDPKIQKLLYPRKTPLIIKNPISPKMSTMRLSLWTGLITTLIYNQKRQQKKICLFESGTCFIPDNTCELQVRQIHTISGIRSGPIFNDHWDLTKRLVDFYDIKGDLEEIFTLTNKLCNINFKSYIHPALQPGQTAKIYLKNTCIGIVGKIHPIVQEKLNLIQPVLIFEIFWNKISKINLPKISKIPIFPKNIRDVSIVIPENISASLIINSCENISEKYSLKIKILDIYKGKSIPNGFKGLTIRLFIQNITYTLKEQEISDIINKYVTILKTQYHAFLRN